MRRSMVYALCGLLLLCCTMLCIPGLVILPVDFTLHLTLGWSRFLVRVVPETSVNWGGVTTAAFCVIALSLGLHGFCRWFFAQVQRRRHIDPATWRTWRPQWTASLVALVVLMFVSGMAAVGVTHSTTWFLNADPMISSNSVREAAARTQAANNLREMGLGVHSYSGSHATLPPGTSFDALGRPLHGWQTFLLPYVEQGPLLKKVSLAVPWNDPMNQEAFATRLHIYEHPSADTDSRDGYALTHYAGNSHVWGTLKPLRLPQDFPDGTSFTILAGEVSSNYMPWGSPLNWRDPTLGINRSADGFGGQDKLRGALILMTDATVRLFPKNVSPEVLRAFATPAGNDQQGVSLPD